MRILSTVAGIRAAEVVKIYRQKNVEYKKAVESFAQGNVAKGFERLDAAGFIKEIDPMLPGEQLATDYVAAIRKDKSALIVSPTHGKARK